MRLWSIHPKYLDSKGLVALWREGLLAKKVLENKTKGYKNHPQLIRFKECQYPVASIVVYLKAIYDEAVNRGYNFDENKLFLAVGKGWAFQDELKVTEGQLNYEFDHLQHRKLYTRDVKQWDKNWAYLRAEQASIKPHPLFNVIQGPIEKWEKVK